ncbi:hypothetical protein E2562_015185 [Oryza meyeriana var. granulata]|uniref:Uncharacterized protein n=1 Tax=Oryza meyeriana var. granulata TaxID=110450 RepID=A0A6G1EWP8_9ORYZ|nr:hypothetical protein E2562_015185 [Oryza meyeriana var. granulata]
MILCNLELLVLSQGCNAFRRRTGSGDRKLGLGYLAAAATILFLVSELHQSHPNSVSNTVTLSPVRSSHPAVLAPLIGVCRSGTVVVDDASGRTTKEVVEKLLERGRPGCRPRCPALPSQPQVAPPHRGRPLHPCHIAAVALTWNIDVNCNYIATGSSDKTVVMAASRHHPHPAAPPPIAGASPPHSHTPAPTSGRAATQSPCYPEALDSSSSSSSRFVGRSKAQRRKDSSPPSRGGAAASYKAALLASEGAVAPEEQRTEENSSRVSLRPEEHRVEGWKRVEGRRRR